MLFRPFGLVAVEAAAAGAEEEAAAAALVVLAVVVLVVVGLAEVGNEINKLNNK